MGKVVLFMVVVAIVVMMLVAIIELTRVLMLVL